MFQLFKEIAGRALRGRRFPPSFDIDDIIDDAFSRWMDLLESRRDEELALQHPSAYAATMIRNEFNTRWRQAERESAQRERLEESSSTTSYESEDLWALRRILTCCFALAPHKFRSEWIDAFCKSILDARTYEEIAHAQRTTLENVRQRVARVRSFLRDCLDKEGRSKP
jgi:RNA polymerase sigma factor (sigma-70 family)